MKFSIIVPYRARSFYLKHFLKGLPKYLEEKQGISSQDYSIIICEQLDHRLFNRGKAINIGALYAFDRGLADYIIAHDVDVIPLENINYRYDGAEEYWFIVAGGTKISKNNFITINGYSNDFEGWGYEDGDFIDRMRFYALDTYFWPFQGIKDQSTILNLEFGSMHCRRLNLKTDEASKNYFEQNWKFKDNIGEWTGYPRFFEPRELGLELGEYDVDKSRSWYIDDKVKSNLEKVEEIRNSNPFLQKRTYETEGLSQLSNEDIIPCGVQGNIHRIGFLNS